MLKLDTGQLAAGIVTSSSPIAGISENSVFNQNNSAGFAVAVTTGSFTINGVAFNVNPAVDTLAGIIRNINGSAAGVVATYNAQTSSLTLTAKTPGPQSILLGASSDSSNFFTAAGLTSGTVKAGTQASLTYSNAQGTHTVFSATNDFTNVIPGIGLTIDSSSPASLPAGSTYYTVTVAPDPGAAEKVIDGFITAYNALIKTLNADTRTPSVSNGSHRRVRHRYFDANQCRRRALRKLRHFALSRSTGRAGERLHSHRLGCVQLARVGGHRTRYEFGRCRDRRFG